MSEIIAKKLIDDLVLDGQLPIAFYNSQLIKLNSNLIDVMKKTYISKYAQVSIPRPNTGKCISKIYELY